MAYDCVISPWLECGGGCDYCPLYGTPDDSLDDDDGTIDEVSSFYSSHY